MSDYNIEKNSQDLSFIKIPVASTNTITVLVMIKTGSRYEEQENNGISHFLEHMFFKGTEKRPDSFTLVSELDSMGADYNAFTSKEYTGFFIKTDYTKAEQVLDIISDMLLHSKFESEEIDREKGVILEEVNMYESNPMMYIDSIFERCLYGDTPTGRDIIGTRDNISNFTRQDFVDYFTTQYSADKVKVVLSGNIEENIPTKAKQYFKELEKTESKDIKSVDNPQSEARVRTKYQDSEQSVLSLGVPGVGINHKDEFVLKVMGAILGGGMSSRLFSRVREREGLAYYVKTSPEFFIGKGHITTEAGVKPGNELKTIQIILEEYKRLKEELVSEEELTKVKDMIQGRISLQVESSDDLANWYGHQAIYRDTMLTPQELIEKIKEVTPQDIQRVAQEVFHQDKLNLALIGPVKETKEIENNLKL